MLLAHWADTLQAHALFLDPEALTIVAGINRGGRWTLSRFVAVPARRRLV